MKTILTDNKTEIARYCADNNLDIEKIMTSPRGYNHEAMIFQHIDVAKGTLGLLDNTPALVTLIIYKKDGKLRFEQTEHTKKYLGILSND